MLIFFFLNETLSVCFLCFVSPRTNFTPATHMLTMVTDKTHTHTTNYKKQVPQITLNTRSQVNTFNTNGHHTHHILPISFLFLPIPFFRKYILRYFMQSG